MRIRERQGEEEERKRGRSGKNRREEKLFFPPFLLSAFPPSSGVYSIRSPGFPLFMWRQHDAFKGAGSCRSFFSSSPPSAYRSLSLSPHLSISLGLSPSSVSTSLSLSHTHIFSPSEWNPTLLFQACPSSPTYLPLSLFPSHFQCLSPRPLPPDETLHSSLKLNLSLSLNLSVSSSSHHLLKSDIKSILFFSFFSDVLAVMLAAMFAVLFWPRRSFLLLRRSVCMNEKNAFLFHWMFFFMTYLRFGSAVIYCHLLFI